MIWECSSCGHQLVTSHRPASCRFCGEDVTFFVAYRAENVLARGGRMRPQNCRTRQRNSRA
ncbi:MAG: hypothetical protein ACOX6T_11770 [Myxococcales bacterium]